MGKVPNRDKNPVDSRKLPDFKYFTQCRVHSLWIDTKNDSDLEKFYIILQGKVGVLIPSEKRVRMTEAEYVKYLAKLKKLNESELYQKTIRLNSRKYCIEGDIIDYLEKVLKKIVYKTEKRPETDKPKTSA